MIPLPVDFSLPDGLPAGASSGGPSDAVEEAAPVPVFRQLRLFAAENPMRARFPRAFMQTVPREPGVYYFRDASGKLLYVGQSHELRKRVGSYRHVHPDRHPRRLVRLVHQVRQIEWEICESPEAAIERERVLLLELRPGFNRAGVWKPPPWWLRVGAEDSGNHQAMLRIELRADAFLHGGMDKGNSEAGDLVGAMRDIPQPEPGPITATLLGPFPSSFRWVHAALLRCLYRWLFPKNPLHALPAGLMGEKALREVSWVLPDEMSAVEVARQICESLQAPSNGGESGPIPMLGAFAAIVHEDLPSMEKEFWQAQVEAVLKFVEKHGCGVMEGGAP